MKEEKSISDSITNIIINLILSELNKLGDWK